MSERSRCASTDPATCSTVDGVTEAPVDALRRRAGTGLFDRAERAPARAHFRAMGVDPARLEIARPPRRARGADVDLRARAPTCSDDRRPAALAARARAR